MFARALALAALLSLAACASLPAGERGLPPPEAAPLARLESARPLLGLALGSGGSRAFAHVGVLKALEAAGIQPDLVAGTSAGSLVGAFYAAGRSAAEIEEIALAFERDEINDYALPDRGFIRGEALQGFVNRALGYRAIEELPRPFAAVATELKTGRIAVFNRGDTGMAVRASSSVPGVFQPVRINGAEYVDGDLKSPVPARVAQAMGAAIVIAVDISREPAQREPSGVFDMWSHSMSIMRRSVIEHETAGEVVLIRPDLAPRGAQTPAERKRELIAAGERAVEAALPQIRARIAAAR